MVKLVWVTPRCSIDIRSLGPCWVSRPLAVMALCWARPGAVWMLWQHSRLPLLITACFCEGTTGMLLSFRVLGLRLLILCTLLVVSREPSSAASVVRCVSFDRCGGPTCSPTAQRRLEQSTSWPVPCPLLLRSHFTGLPSSAMAPDFVPPQGAGLGAQCLPSEVCHQG